MRWTWLIVSSLSSTVGDLVSAKGMISHGELNHFGPHSIGRLLRYIVTHRLILTGILFNAISFFSFLALLSISELSFAVPATALAYVMKTALAHWYLGEHVSWPRWTGAILVTVGVLLLSK